MLSEFFLKIWGAGEKRYSSIIAQTLGLSKSFEDFFEEKLGIKNVISEITSIQAEEPLGQSEKIDILVIYDNGRMLVGIENKKWAGLQDRQLHRYAEALKKRNGNYKLVLLSPSSYVVPRKERPDGLVTISYKEIIEWIKNVSVNSEFETSYLRYLLSYIEEMEMMPFEGDEIRSLLYYSVSLKKIDSILNGIRNDSDGQIENSLGNFKLFLRMIKDFPVYIGVRFGKNWYYSDNLLNDSPECLIYIKDNWNESEQATNNMRVKSIHSKLIAENDLQGEKIDFYPRKNRNECRLAIRHSLQDFENKNISEVVDWFNKMIDKLERDAKD